jgi:hypothetical protein
VPVRLMHIPLTSCTGVRVCVRACVRACVLALQVACLLVLVCCSDVHRPSFKHTYGYSNTPVQPRN